MYCVAKSILTLLLLQGGMGSWPVYLAVENGHEEIVRMLFEVKELACLFFLLI